MRRVLYVTGTRADFGLMQRTLERIHADSRLELELCVTGMHLIESYGHTVNEIQAAGLPIAGTIPVKLDGSDGRSMAHAIADELHGMVELLASRRPDIVLLLGDRGEMLAGALAALHLNIPIAHIHGGELSGTVDEPVRHAISKLSHYHFTSTEGARERLLRMGERPEQVFVTGAPGLDGIIDEARADRDALCRTYGFDVTRQIAMLVFHPVVQEAKQAATQAQTLLETLLQHGYQIIAMMPNSDAGGSAVRQLLEDSRHQQDIRVLTHLGRERYLDHLAMVDLLAGNSSSGIIEAASFGLPVINVGSRQSGRERSKNTFDAEPTAISLTHAIAQARNRGRSSCSNVYGDGRAASRITDLLAKLPLGPHLLSKQNAY